MIGTCGYAHVNTNENYCEIGYVLSPYYQGKGYMSEAVGRLLFLTFEVFGFDYAKLRIIAENKASLRLAEKLGFEFENNVEMEIKDEMKTVSVYVLTKEKFRNKK